MWNITEISQMIKIDVRRTNFISVICRDYSSPSLFKQGGKKEKDRESLGRHLALKRTQGCSEIVAIFFRTMKNSAWKK